MIFKEFMFMVLVGEHVERHGRGLYMIEKNEVYRLRRVLKLWTWKGSLQNY